MVEGHPAQADLVRYALTFPGAYIDHPWGEIVVKAGKKIFAFFSSAEYNAGRLRVTTKLPHSHLEALDLPFTERPGYNLGKHGWVTTIIEPGKDAPLDLLEEWIEESYRAVVLKRLVAELDARNGIDPA